MVAAVIWAIALPLAALGRARPQVPTAAWIGTTFVYAAGAAVCHQRPERSFQLAGQPLPVCARCLGIYGAAAVAALVFSASRRKPADGRGSVDARARARSAAFLAALPTAATVMWEWRGGGTLSNLVRAIAGVPLGLFVAWVVAAAGHPDAQSE